MNFIFSTKWDVWSWGVVLVEVVSGLPVTDQTREEPDLVSHFQGQVSCILNISKFYHVYYHTLVITS